MTPPGNGHSGIERIELARLINQARRAAHRRLAERYPKVYRVLLDEERARLGLPPTGQLPTGRPPE